MRAVSARTDTRSTSGATARAASRNAVIQAATAVTASRGRRRPPSRLAATCASSADLEEDERRMAARAGRAGSGRAAPASPSCRDATRPAPRRSERPTRAGCRRHRLSRSAALVTGSGGGAAGASAERPRGDAGRLDRGGRPRARVGVEPPPHPCELDLRRRAHLDVLTPRGEPLQVRDVLASGEVPDQDLARRAGRPRRRTAACGPCTRLAASWRMKKWRSLATTSISRSSSFSPSVERLDAVQQLVVVERSQLSGGASSSGPSVHGRRCDASPIIASPPPVLDVAGRLVGDRAAERASPRRAARGPCPRRRPPTSGRRRRRSAPRGPR